MRTSVFIATSLDGFIARENGEIDWLAGTEPSRLEDYGFRSFLKSVDYLVMGRNTFEAVRRFGDWPYDSTPVVVLSHGDPDIDDEMPGRVELMHGLPSEIVEALAARGAEHLYIDGGVTIQGFLREGMIDRLIITRIPILIGRGIPLFGEVERDISLHHVQTRSYDNGLVQSEYAVVKDPT